MVADTSGKASCRRAKSWALAVGRSIASTGRVSQGASRLDGGPAGGSPRLYDHLAPQYSFPRLRISGSALNEELSWCLPAPLHNSSKFSKRLYPLSRIHMFKRRRFLHLLSRKGQSGCGVVRYAGRTATVTRKTFPVLGCDHV
jgi:hypothetical protein